MLDPVVPGRMRSVADESLERSSLRIVEAVGGQGAFVVAHGPRRIGEGKTSPAATRRISNPSVHGIECVESCRGCVRGDEEPGLREESLTLLRVASVCGT